MRLEEEPDEAEVVRLLFARYLALGRVRALIAETRTRGLVTKRHTFKDGRVVGGAPFTRGHLYYLLTNPLYIGEVRHRGVRYLGQHDPIIDPETFEAAQRQLAQNAQARRSATNAKGHHLLVGLAFDETGDRLCATHATKAGRRYRYYVSKRLVHGTDTDGWRLPAKALESAVIESVGAFLRDEGRLIEALALQGEAPGRLRACLDAATGLAERLAKAPAHEGKAILHGLVERVEIAHRTLRIAMVRQGLCQLIGLQRNDTPGPITLEAPLELRRRGVEARLVINGTSDGARAPDRNLVRLVAQAHRWLEELRSGRAGSVRTLADRDGWDASDVSRILRLAFLAPEIVEAILDGRQPIELTARQLRLTADLPMDWTTQMARLGFEA